MLRSSILCGHSFKLSLCGYRYALFISLLGEEYSVKGREADDNDPGRRYEQMSR